MDLAQHLSRRAWLARVGVTTAGVTGLLVSWACGSNGDPPPQAAGGASVGTPAAREPAGATSPAATAPAAAAAPAVTAEARPLRVNLGFVSAYVVTRGDAAAIVDTGVAGSADAIGAVLRGAGLDWPAVQHVILTHHHADHAGSAADILSRAARAELWIGEADIPNLQGARSPRPAKDGDEVFGLRIVGTPGHTAGHISVLEPRASLLFLGDAIFNTGALAVSPSQFTANMRQANDTVRRLGTMTIERAMFGHGEPLESGAAAAFKRLGDTLPA